MIIAMEGGFSYFLSPEQFFLNSDSILHNVMRLGRWKNRSSEYIMASSPPKKILGAQGASSKQLESGHRPRMEPTMIEGPE